MNLVIFPTNAEISYISDVTAENKPFCNEKIFQIYNKENCSNKTEKRINTLKFENFLDENKSKVAKTI